MEIIVIFVSVFFPVMVIAGAWCLSLRWRKERKTDKETIVVMRKVITKKNEIISTQHEMVFGNN